jgi:hypothetical protein
MAVEQWEMSVGGVDKIGLLSGEVEGVASGPR